MAKLSDENLFRMCSQLCCYLDRSGPSTKGAIMRDLKWKSWQLGQVIASHPSWLVVVGLKRVAYHGAGQSLYACSGQHIFGECPECGKRNYLANRVGKPCLACATAAEEPEKEPSDAVYARLPTDEPPGSEGKIQVLRARYASGVELWNESDNSVISNDDDEPEEFDDDWDDE